MHAAMAPSFLDGEIREDHRLQLAALYAMSIRRMQDRAARVLLVVSSIKTLTSTLLLDG